MASAITIGSANERGRAMTVSQRVPITRLPSGVGKLDDILGGGWPEYSFNLIIGEPGSGKTTLAHQFMFANASDERRALYFTVLGEPTIKMLRYQRQFGFFDAAKVPSAVRFVNLAAEAAAGDLDAVLQRMIDEVAKASPAFIAVDSFRTIVGDHRTLESDTVIALARFVNLLAQQLTTWEVTSFLI